MGGDILTFRRGAVPAWSVCRPDGRLGVRTGVAGRRLIAEKPDPGDASQELAAAGHGPGKSARAAPVRTAGSWHARHSASQRQAANGNIGECLPWDFAN